jgi:glutaryl-CoA dehydrogenase
VAAAGWDVGHPVKGTDVNEPSELYHLDDMLSDEDRELQQRVRRFCDEKVVPVANERWERAESMTDLLPGVVDLGILGGSTTGYGCAGLSPVASGIVSLELARGDGSFCTVFGVHSGLTMGTIATLGSEEQKQRWLPAMASLDKLGAFGLTEPDHGSDVVALETRATRDGDTWVLDGRKRWIGLGDEADLVIVWARDDDGDVGAFVVEHPEGGKVEGFRAEVITGKIGRRAVLQSSLWLDGVRIPAGNRLAEARSFKDTQRFLGHSRMGVAWEAVGHAEAAYTYALPYVRQRTQFGRSLSSFQLIQEKLARMLAEITGMRLMVMRMAQLAQEGRATGPIASVAKMHCAATARTVCQDARDMMGGNGLLLENHVARHLADVEVTYTYEGTDTVQALIVGREITGTQAFAN